MTKQNIQTIFLEKYPKEPQKMFQYLNDFMHAVQWVRTDKKLRCRGDRRRSKSN